MQCSPSVSLAWHLSLCLVVPESQVAADSRGGWGEGSCWGRLETGIRIRGAAAGETQRDKEESFPGRRQLLYKSPGADGAGGQGVQVKAKHVAPNACAPPQHEHGRMRT